MKVRFSKSYTLLLFIGLTSSFFSCQHTGSSKKTGVFADFEPTATTAFVWSQDHAEIIPKLASVISSKDHVTIYFNSNKTDVAKIHAVLNRHKANPENVTLAEIPLNTDNIWIRDFGPVISMNEARQPEIISFNYFGTSPGYAEYFGQQKKIPVIQSSFISTGGAREVNGNGSVILVETHERDVNRGKSLEAIETELSEKLGLTNFIWLEKGIPQDDNPLKGPLVKNIYPNGINGHVDEFCRFADENTILISSVSEEEANKHPILKEAKIRLDRNYEILANSRDQNGRKFNIIKVPFAPLIIVDRSDQNQQIFVTPVTSYMNFIITNSKVILPSYLLEDIRQADIEIKEKEVYQIFNQVFPNHEILMIPVGNLNYFSGGFHCISLNIPQLPL